MKKTVMLACLILLAAYAGIAVNCTGASNKDVPDTAKTAGAAEISTRENAAETKEETQKSADSFTVLESKNPPMNSPDIRSLQNRLLSLGFNEIGEADGYYGDLIESVITNIKIFSGFKPEYNDIDLEGLPYWEQNYARFLPDGKVNKALWDYIFDNEKTSFLSNVAAILEYELSSMIKAEVFEEITVLDEEMEEEKLVSEYVYASSADQKVKVVRYNESVTRGYSTQITYYLVNDASYFIHYVITDNVEGLYSELETYLVKNDAIFKMLNGIPQPYDDTAMIELKNAILSKYIAG